MPFGCSVSMATLSFSMLSAPVDSTACNTKMYQQNYETLYDGKPKKYLSNGYRILVFSEWLLGGVMYLDHSKSNSETVSKHENFQKTLHVLLVIWLVKI